MLSSRNSTGLGVVLALTITSLGCGSKPPVREPVESVCYIDPPPFGIGQLAIHTELVNGEVVMVLDLDSARRLIFYLNDSTDWVAQVRTCPHIILLPSGLTRALHERMGTYETPFGVGALGEAVLNPPVSVPGDDNPLDLVSGPTP
jgi:hypothetical protein